MDRCLLEDAQAIDYCCFSNLFKQLNKLGQLYGTSRLPIVLVHWKARRKDKLVFKSSSYLFAIGLELLYLLWFTAKERVPFAEVQAQFA